MLRPQPRMSTFGLSPAAPSSFHACLVGVRCSNGCSARVVSAAGEITISGWMTDRRMEIWRSDSWPNRHHGSKQLFSRSPRRAIAPRALPEQTPFERGTPPTTLDHPTDALKIWVVARRARAAPIPLPLVIPKTTSIGQCFAPSPHCHSSSGMSPVIPSLHARSTSVR